MGIPQTSSLALLALVSVLGLWCDSASADALESTYGTLDTAEVLDPLREERHSVHIESSADDLLLRVRRDVRNVGHRVDEAIFGIEMPVGATTVGFRSRQGATWIPGRLLTREHAAELYEHYTHSGPLASQGPALMEWVGLGDQSLSVFPVHPGKSVAVEYELRVPTCYQFGKRIALYPKRVEEDSSSRQLRRPEFRFAKGIKGQIIDDLGSLPANLQNIVDVCVGREMYESLEVLEDNSLIVIDADAKLQVRASVGTFNMGSERSLGEVFVELAPRLSALPEVLDVVFVLDMSFSQPETKVVEQLRWVEGYLAHVPDARYQIVLARRHATPLFRAFQPASGSAALLRGLRSRLPARGNGSNLDAATRLAMTLLPTDSPRPGRVVAFTDSKLRKSLTSATLANALATRAGVIAHVIDTSVGSSGDGFERDDDHALAAAVMSTGGMLGSLPFEVNRSDIRSAVLSLVRPTQIDGVELADDTPWSDVVWLPRVLKEGFGERVMNVFDGTPGPLTFKGKIWGQEMSWDAHHDSGVSQRIPALALGRELSSQLTKSEVVAIAEAGKTVSRETSFLAMKPNQRPSSYDYPDAPIGGMGTISFSSSFSTRCGGAHGIVAAPEGFPRVKEGVDWGAAIAGQLGERVSACAIRHSKENARVMLMVETTGREIVDVAITAPASPYADCVVEAAWQTRLGKTFERHNGSVAVELDAEN